MLLLLSEVSVYCKGRVERTHISHMAILNGCISSLHVHVQVFYLFLTQ